MGRAATLWSQVPVLWGPPVGQGVGHITYSSREVSASHGSSEPHNWKAVVWWGWWENQQLPTVPKQ